MTHPMDMERSSYTYRFVSARGSFQRSAEHRPALGARIQSIAAKIAEASACSAANALKKWKWLPKTLSSE